MKRSDKVRQAYPSDLTDAQWAVIEPLYSGMRTHKWSKRELTNAVLYFVKTGCPWRLKVYEGGNISVKFKYADGFRRIAEYIERNSTMVTGAAG